MPDIVTLTMNPALDVTVSTERVEPIRKNRCADLRRDPGGGGINVARVLGRFGADCRAVYPAGGASGRLLHRLLDDEGVDSLPISVAGETREDFTVQETASGRQFRFVLPGTELSRRECWRVLKRLTDGLDPSAFVVASGSLPPGIASGFYAEVAGRVRAAGARLLLDTSGEALRSALAEGVFLVKPNLRELRELVGRPLPRAAAWEAAALDLVADGKAEIVALTLGERGAFLASRKRRLRAGGLRITPVSAVGAGDSFMAGMVWQLAKDGNVERAFRRAVAAGSAALLTPGTELCHRRDVERLYRQVRLSPV